MCFDPVSLAVMAAGAALSAGGSVISNNETKKNAERAAAARNAELKASRLRLRGFEDKARAEGVQKALDKFDPAAQQQAQTDNQQRRDVAITDATTPTAGVGDIPLPGDTSEVVKGQMAKKLRDVFNTATARAKLSATPLTYNDNLMGNNVALTDAGRLVDTYNGFARQEAAMLPSQQEFAAFASQKDPSIWGPLLKAGGTALASGAGGGYFAAKPTPGMAYPTYVSPVADQGLRFAPATS